MALKSPSRTLPLAVALVGALFLSSCGYGAIPTREERAQAAWAEVQNQHQMRTALIPNLIATTQAADIQDPTALNEVIEARARVLSAVPEYPSDGEIMARSQTAQDDLSSAVSELLAVTEAHPELQANRNFLTLRSQLEGAETRITIARHDYNEAVRAYNSELRAFPGIIWARTLHNKARPMYAFEASGAGQATSRTGSASDPATTAPMAPPAS